MLARGDWYLQQNDMRKSKGLLGLVFLLVLLGCGLLLSGIPGTETISRDQGERGSTTETGGTRDWKPGVIPWNVRSILQALQRINPEIVGWLYVPQIGVDSPYFNRTDGHENT